MVALATTVAIGENADVEVGSAGLTQRISTGDLCSPLLPAMVTRMSVKLNGRRNVGRIAAGVQLLIIAVVWLILWLPLAIYCLVAIMTTPLRRRRAPLNVFG